jgi:hypothetical protein
MKVKIISPRYAWSKREWDATDAALAWCLLWRAEPGEDSIQVPEPVQYLVEVLTRTWPGSAKPYIWFARISSRGFQLAHARRQTTRWFYHGDTAPPIPPPSEWVESWRAFLASLPFEENAVLATIALDYPINPAEETRRGVQGERRKTWLRLYQERFPGAGNTNKPNDKTGVTRLAALEECPKGNFSRSVK